MPTDQELAAALQWSAGFRGATDPEEAFDWMAQVGLVRMDWPSGTYVLTEEGRKRGEEVYNALAEAGDSRRARRRTTLMLGMAALALLWRMRR
jgi:hypothetical protein